MNKLILSLVLALGTFGASAQTFKAFDFLGGNQVLFLTNNTTTTYGDIGVPMTNALGVACYSLTNLYSTNSLIAPGTLYTNANTYFGQAWYDVPMFSDRNGNAATASIALYFVGVTAQSTNTLTLSFRKLQKFVNGVPALAGTATADTFTFSVLGNGTTAVGITTNLPSTLVNGAAGLRLQTIVEADNGAAGSFYLQSLTLNGFPP